MDGSGRRLLPAVRCHVGSVAVSGGSQRHFRQKAVVSAAAQPTALATAKPIGNPTVSPRELLPLDLDENRETAVAPAHHPDDVAESDAGRVAASSSGEQPTADDPTGFGIRARHAVAALIVTRVRDVDDVDADGLKERLIKARAFVVMAKFSGWLTRAPRQTWLR